jgi:hypothetical protein
LYRLLLATGAGFAVQAARKLETSEDMVRASADCRGYSTVMSCDCTSMPLLGLPSLQLFQHLRVLTSLLAIFCYPPQLLGVLVDVILYRLNRYRKRFRRGVRVVGSFELPQFAQLTSDLSY